MDSYEKKYKEALERARELSKTTTGANYEYIFPELAESEDERIKKGITELVKQSSEILDKKNQERMLAWLEKQGEQKWSEEDEMMCTIAINACKYANDEFESFNDNYEKAIMWLESLKKRKEE